MILDSTSRKYRVVLTAAKTTSDMSVIVNWEPISKMPNLMPQLERTSTNGVTAVDILATTDLPKRITSLTIYNKDTASKTVQVFLDDAGTAFLIVNVTLQPGETLGYSESTQWYTGSLIGSYAALNGNALEDFSAHRLIVGDPGSEGTGINIGGVTYESSFKVSDIDGTNYAQTILHRHSTTLEPLIVGARSNSDTSSHAAVTAGQGLFSVYAAGWAGSNYKLFGSMTFGADSTGAISNTSAPGKFSISLAPNGSVTPVQVLGIDNAGAATFTGTVAVAPATAAGHAVQAAQIQAQSVKAFTTAGTSTAYTLTPVPAIIAYAIGQEFDVTFNAACGAAPTININGLGAVNLVERVIDGTYSNIASGRIPSSWRSKCVMISLTQMLVRELSSAPNIQAQTFSAFTTAGTSTAYTLTPSPAIIAYAIGQEFDVIFNAACGATPTINVNGLGAVNLVDRLVDGTYYNIPSGRIPINWRSKCVMISANQMLVRDTPCEAVTSTVLADSAISLTTNTAANITSVTIPAGDWEIFGNVNIAPGTNTNKILVAGSISATSATFGDQKGRAQKHFGNAGIVSSTTADYIPMPSILVSLSASTTYYLIGYSTFSVSTMVAAGTITAKRYK